MAASTRRERIFIIVSILLGILVLEGAVRLIYQVVVEKIPDDVVPYEVGQFDEMLGWSLKPSSFAVSTRTGYEVQYRINAKGLRDDETSYEKPTGVFRIVMVGDSNTFGFGVPIEKHFTSLVEGYFKDVEVVNMGVSGFGVDQKFLFLKSEGFKYEPDLVVAYVPHYGDHRHMHVERWGQSKPRFVLEQGKLVLTNSPVLRKIPAPGTFRRIHRWFVKHIMLYKLLRNGVAALIFKEQARTPSNQSQQDDTNIENEAFANELNELGEAIIAAMNDESKRHGANFVLLTPIKRLHEFCLKNGILTFDVSKGLSNQRFDLPDNLSHINESGNGVLAWEIAELIRANELIPNKYFGER